jgi:hypothetical protein
MVSTLTRRNQTVTRTSTIAAALLATVAQYGALTVVAATKAHAMDYTYKVLTNTSKDGKTNDFLAIYAKGEIAWKDDEAFAAWVKTLPANAAAQQTVVVVFDSFGGNLSGAFGIGEYIRKAGWRTAVDDDANCASACVIAWGASAQKFASSSSHIGVHSITMDRSKIAEADRASLKESDDVYAAVYTLGEAAQLKIYGAPDNIVVKAMMTDGKTDMYWLTGDDAKAWNVTVTQPRPKALGEPTPVASK